MGGGQGNNKGFMCQSSVRPCAHLHHAWLAGRGRRTTHAGTDGRRARRRRRTAHATAEGLLRREGLERGGGRGGRRRRTRRWGRTATATTDTMI